MTTCTCRETLPSEGKFCIRCGKPTAPAAMAAIACPSCGREATAPGSFCTHCGAPLPVRHAPAAPARATAFHWRWALLTIPIVVAVSFAIAYAAGLVAGSLGFATDAEETITAVGTASVLLGMFIGGLVVGWVSPGRTVLEPGVGIAAAVTAINVLYQDVAGLVAAWVLPFAIGTGGAALGEWLQGRWRRR